MYKYTITLSEQELGLAQTILSEARIKYNDIVDGFEINPNLTFEDNRINREVTSVKMQACERLLVLLNQAQKV